MVDKDMPDQKDKALGRTLTEKEQACRTRTSEMPQFEEIDEGNWHFNAKDLETCSRIFGVTSGQFMGAIAHHCGNVSGRIESLKEDKNHALAIIAEIAPKDGIETMLATQMAAVHIAAMRHSRLMAGAETIPQLDIQEKVFNKLTRTFAAQVEALRKHRHGGEQKMTVEHVTVENGGQAIVGHVARGGGNEKP